MGKILINFKENISTIATLDCSPPEHLECTSTLYALKTCKQIFEAYRAQHRPIIKKDIFDIVNSFGGRLNDYDISAFLQMYTEYKDISEHYKTGTWRLSVSFSSMEMASKGATCILDVYLNSEKAKIKSLWYSDAKLEMFTKNERAEIMRFPYDPSVITKQRLEDLISRLEEIEKKEIKYLLYKDQLMFWG